MKKLVIKEMFAFVAEDADGEGVIGACLDGKTWTPLVGADMDRVWSLVPVAEMIKRTTGKDYRILRFTNRVDITNKIKKVK